MKFGGTIVCFGIAVFCISTCLAVDCTDGNSMKAAQRRCFENEGLELNVGSDMQNAIQNDPEVACRDKVSYERALRCALQMSRNCMVQLGQSPDILPDVDKVIQGLTYMCDNLNNIDAECVSRQTGAMQQCAKNKAVSAFYGNTNLDVTYITCKAFEIAVECVEESLDVCGRQTVNVMVAYTQNYMTPPACGNNGGSGSEMTTMAPMMTTQLVTVVPMLPEVRCYSESSLQQGQHKCFHREGIDIDLPEIHITGDAQATKKSYLDAILSNQHRFETVCRELPKYQRALECVFDLARHCMPEEYKDYLPSSRNMKSMLSELCTNIHDINQNCIKNQASALFDCGYRKGSEHRTRDLQALLCNAFKFNAQCQNEVLPACGCKTTRLYVEISKKYLNPPACSRIYEPTPVCGRSGEFISSAVATQSVAASVLLALVVLVRQIFM